MAHERGRRPDVENEKRVELRSYSHNLTNKILRKENGEVGRDIPEKVLVTYQEKSLGNRNKFWKENAPDTNFAQQLLAWAGDPEESGLMYWVDRQTDPDVIGMLEEVGLKGNNQNLGDLRQQLQSRKVTDVLNAVNKDIQAMGLEGDMLTTGTLLTEENEHLARAIIFYAQYLNPTEKNADDTRAFIDTVVKKASSQSDGDIDRTISKLQKVADLFGVAGVDMQDALGALMVAKAHALDDHAKVQAVPENAGLNNYENDVWVKLSAERPAQSPAQQMPEDEGQSYTESAPAPEPLKAGEARNVQEVFTELKPDAKRAGNPYWVEHVPSDFADKLSDKELADLELKETFFVLEPNGREFFPNEKVFPQARALFHKNPRFDNGEALTQGDSGILAEAAASAETPEQQAQLYKQIGEVILRVHQRNPKLLEEFLNMQSSDSSKQFAFFDYVKSSNLLSQNTESMMQEFKSRPAKSEGEFRSRLKPYETYERNVLEDFSSNQARLIALRMVNTKLEQNENILDDMLPIIIDIPNTVAGDVWLNRIVNLQEALKKNPLDLTPEQIRQIEFLGHSVDIVKAMDMMRGTAAVVPTEPGPTLPTPEVSTHESASQKGSDAGQEVNKEGFPDLKAEDFFAGLDDAVASNIDNGLWNQRRETLYVDPQTLDTFDSVGEAATQYEITKIGKDGQEELALLEAVAEAVGNPGEQAVKSSFIKNLSEDNSVSDKVFEGLLGDAYQLGPNTLLAYVVEAGATPTEQTELFTKLVKQVRLMYEQHDGTLREDMKIYLQKNPQIAGSNYDHVIHLFENQDIAGKRLTEIKQKVEQKQPLTREDYFDLGFFALPLDLQKVTHRMQPRNVDEVRTDLENLTPTSNNQE